MKSNINIKQLVEDLDSRFRTFTACWRLKEKNKVCLLCILPFVCFFVPLYVIFISSWGWFNGKRGFEAEEEARKKSVLEDFLSCSFGTLVSRCIVYELL
jgi:hypothetical protein